MANWHTGELSEWSMTQPHAYRMIRRRAADAGISLRPKRADQRKRLFRIAPGRAFSKNQRSLR